jgi:hypothetical protein
VESYVVGQSPTVLAHDTSWLLQLRLGGLVVAIHDFGMGFFAMVLENMIPEKHKTFKVYVQYMA